MVVHDEISRYLQRIEEIKRALSAIGEMHPGSISEQYNVCGNPNCACKNPENPKKHGPYLQLSFTRKGKSTTRFIKPDERVETQERIDNYKLFKKLTDEWIDLSVEIAKLRKKVLQDK